jgi:hypothetical protein
VSAPRLQVREAAARSERPEGWRQVLEQRWQRKLDEVIVLSRACYDGQAVSSDEAAAEGHEMAAGRLGLRLATAHRELAKIGAAIEVMSADSPVTCGTCGRPVPPEWVIEEPHLAKCPDCALDSVRWRRRPRKRAQSDRPNSSAGG